MAKATHFILNRTRTIKSTAGHAVHFEKGKPRTVPPAIEDLVVQHGAMPCDEDGNVVFEEQEDEASDEEPTGKEREDLLDMAVELLVERNDPDEFDSHNRPKVKALSEQLEFTVTADERDAAWKRYQDAQ